MSFLQYLTILKILILLRQKWQQWIIKLNEIKVNKEPKLGEKKTNFEVSEMLRTSKIVVSEMVRYRADFSAIVEGTGNEDNNHFVRGVSGSSTCDNSIGLHWTDSSIRLWQTISSNSPILKDLKWSINPLSAMKLISTAPTTATETFFAAVEEIQHIRHLRDPHVINDGQHGRCVKHVFRRGNFPFPRLVQSEKHPAHRVRLQNRHRQENRKENWGWKYPSQKREYHSTSNWRKDIPKVTINLKLAVPSIKILIFLTCM